jgi:hypothetical protein
MTKEEKKQQTRDRINASRKECGLAPLEYANPKNREEVAEKLRKADEHKTVNELKGAAEKFAAALQMERSEPAKAGLAALEFRGKWNAACRHTGEDTIAEGPEAMEQSKKALRKAMGGGW